jgi:hypothetical protein
MSESPIITQKKRELESLVKFNRFLGMADHREPVEIKIEFHNKRFNRDAGFAIIDKPSMSMSTIVAAMAKEAENQIIRLNREISEYEKEDRIRRDNSLGELDNKNGEGSQCNF